MNRAWRLRTRAPAAGRVRRAGAVAPAVGPPFRRPGRPRRGAGPPGNRAGGRPPVGGVENDSRLRDARWLSAVTTVGAQWYFGAAPRVAAPPGCARWVFPRLVIVEAGTIAGKALFVAASPRQCREVRSRPRTSIRRGRSSPIEAHATGSWSLKNDRSWDRSSAGESAPLGHASEGGCGWRRPMNRGQATSGGRRRILRHVRPAAHDARRRLVRSDGRQRRARSKPPPGRSSRGRNRSRPALARVDPPAPGVALGTCRRASPSGRRGSGGRACR